MQPPWKLVVEDLGRIGRAEIEARSLLLFVGGNNTGKTYLASLLWGFARREQATVLVERAFHRTGFELGKIELQQVARRPAHLAWQMFEEQGQPLLPADQKLHEARRSPATRRDAAQARRRGQRLPRDG